MAYRSLDEFLIRLEQEGELVRISEPITTGTQITEIVADSDKALWFEHVADGRFPIVANVMGTAQRMAWALGVDHLDALTDHTANLVDINLSDGLGSLLNHAGTIMSAVRSAGMNSAYHRNPPAQAIVHPPDLTLLPALRWWRDESHPSLTMAQLITRDDGQQTARLTRAVIYDTTRLGVDIPLAAGQNEPVPAVIVLGGDPAAAWSACAPLPKGIDPLWLAGWIRRKPVPLTMARTQRVSFPADADIVIEGWLDFAGERQRATIAGESGYYLEDYPLVTMHVTGISHRTDALMPVCVSGRNVSWMAKAIERLTLPLVRRMIEEVVDVNVPVIGSVRHLTIVSCHQRIHGQARKVIHGIWSMGDLALSKTVIVVDKAVDVHDLRAVAWAVLTHVDWTRDIIQVDGMLHPHDQASRLPGYGGKLGIDATCKASGVHADDDLWHNKVTILPVEDDASQVPDPHGVHPILVLVDGDVDPTEPMTIARHVLSSVDWSRDLTIYPDGSVMVDARRRSKSLPARLS